MSERETFDAWIKAPPYEKITATIAGDGMWPGQYVSYEVQLAWEAWHASAAALAARLADAEAENARLREDAARLEEALNDIATNYDHDEQTREHTPSYGGTCRVCLAERTLARAQEARDESR